MTHIRFALLPVLALSITTTIGACVTADSLGPYRLIPAHTLKQLLRHGMLLELYPLGLQAEADTREYFYSNGRYEACGTAPQQTGSYTVQYPMLCIKTQMRKFCRKLYVNNTGHFKHKILFKDPHTANAISDVMLTPHSNKQDCTSKLIEK